MLGADHVFDDATSQEEISILEEPLARERDRLRLLLEVNNALVSKLDTRELFAAISTSLRQALHHDYTALVMHDPETDKLRVHVLDFPGGKGLVQEEMAIPVKGTPVGEAFTSGKPQLLSRADLERFPPEIARRLAGEGLKSACSLPLLTHNRALGTLNLASLKENAFMQEDLDFLGQVANQVAIAIDNTMAYQEIAELKDKLAEEKLYLEDEIRTEHNFGEIIGESAVLKRILRQVEIVAPADSTVLIQGETGTGKELIARAIHNLSPRRERTFVKINCAAIPTGLLESELFGHERGAFTGAIAQKIGRFELAHRGTLFLDEVGDIPLELQPKLLRVLQEKELERLGSTRTVRIDVRLVAATNRDLTQMVDDRLFRNDLYYRLNVFPILMPSLRERAEDIPLLVRYFVQKHARQMNKRIDTIPAEEMKALARYQWPGNVRELENLVERSVLLTQGSVLHVPPGELKPRKENVTCPTTTLEDAEREHILRALRDAKWAVGGAQGAAVRLGMKRTTLYSKMKKLRISPRNR
jgi:formate hydrogenlyase transcriptional activator